MAKKIRRHNNIKHGTIELVLLLLLQSGRKYGYQLAQELSEHTSSQYELKETTMYPTLYRLSQNGYLDSEQVKVGERRTRVYYYITDSGRQYLQELLTEYKVISGAIEQLLSYTESENKDSSGGLFLKIQQLRNISDRLNACTEENGDLKDNLFKN